MIKNKKIMAILMAVVMATSLAACKPKTKEIDINAKVDTSNFVTVNMVVLGNKPTNGQFEKVQAKWNELLKAKVNANLSMTWVEWTDWYTKYNLLLASGQSLDLITTASDWLDLWPNAQKGAFMNIETLLPKYAPKTYGEVTKENWAQSSYNGHIVAIPEDQYTQWVNHGFLYRGDWAKEFGITEPITNWETFGKYLQGIKDKKPGVIPWDLAAGGYSGASGWFQSKTTGVNIDAVPTALGTSLFNGKSADDPFTVVGPYMEQTFMDYATTMKKWGDAGYWRADALNYKGDDMVAMQAGKNGVKQHHTQTFIGSTDIMNKKQPGSDLQFFPFSAEGGNLVSMPITHGAMSVGASSKNPERALMVYDLIRNDSEVYKLVNWGMEGVQYTVKDGIKSQPEGYDDTKDGFYSDFWGGRMDKFELPSATVYSGWKEVYAAYDKIKKPYPYGQFAFDKTPVDAEIAALSDVSNKYLPSISVGQAGDPEKAVTEFREKLKAAGYDKLLAEVQKQMTAYKALVKK